MATVNYLVSGKVQSVGYRRYAQRQAEALGLAGWARNLADGSVEVQANGTDEQHRAFAEKLKQGPLFSVVEAVKPLAVATQEISGFQILEDAERPDGGYR